MAGTVALLKQTFRDFGEDQCPTLAAALSYYTVFSLPPLLVLLLLLLSAFMEPQQVRELLQGEVGAVLGPAGSEQIAGILENAEQPDFSKGPMALLGVVGLLFGAVGAFIHLQSSLNRIWEVAPDPDHGGIRHFIGQRVASFGMLLTIAFLLLVSLVISAFLTAFGESIAGALPGALSSVMLQVINTAATFGVIMLLFALLYRYVPDARIDWQDVWVGAAFTAALFVIGKFVLGLYLGRSQPGSAFGAAGALASLLVWIYYSALILFLGAELTQAWTLRRGDGIVPADGAVRVIEKKENVPADDPRARRTGRRGDDITPRLRQDEAERNA